MEKLRQSRGQTPIKEERRLTMLHTLFWKGPVEWLFFQVMILFPPFAYLLSLFDLGEPQFLFAEIGVVINITLAVYFLFTFERLHHFRPFIDFTLAPPGWLRRTLAMSHLLLLPIAGFFFIAPFTTALALKVLQRQPATWVKTPRTKEADSR